MDCFILLNVKELINAGEDVLIFYNDKVTFSSSSLPHRLPIAPLLISKGQPKAFNVDEPTAKAME